MQIKLVSNEWQYAINGRLRKALKRMYKLRLALKVQRMAGQELDLPFLSKSCIGSHRTACPFVFVHTMFGNPLYRCLADECFKNKKIPTDDYKCNIIPYFIRGYKIQAIRAMWRYRVEHKTTK
jgi:hypothetical protein